MGRSRAAMGKADRNKSRGILPLAIVVVALCSVYQILSHINQDFMIPPVFSNFLMAPDYGSSWVHVQKPLVDANTGEVFSGDRIRQYQGELTFAEGFQSNRDSQTSAEPSVLSSWFPLMAKKCDAWGVVTTINAPTKSVRIAAMLRDYCLVIVGDTKTPKDYLAQGKWQGRDNIVYLSVEDQQNIKHPFVEMIPYRSFARKNIGYLFAVRHGAKVIFDFDDDNVLRPALDSEVASDDDYEPMSPFYLKALDLNQTLVRHLPAKHINGLVGKAFNPYPLMKASEPGIWPRGFPLEEVKYNSLTDDISADVRGGSISTSSIAVVQSVCDGDPDVDAIYRLTRMLPVSFDTSNGASKLLVPTASFAPYNAQATVHMYDAFWGMLLPFTVTGRVTDIWRSYFAQRIFQDLNLAVLYAPSMVTHTRNLHDYMADFNAENDLYRKTSSLLKFLNEWDESEYFLPARLEKLYIALYERDFIGLADVQMLQQWLRALWSVGYDFPKILQKKENVQLVPMDQPMLQDQPFQAFPYFNTGGPNGNVTYPEYLTSLGLDSNGANNLAWQGWLRGVNRTNGPDHGVLKLVIMTKDEWPILKKWMLYHGELIGFENLYVIDGSADPRCTGFLKQMRDAYGAQVIFSTSGLDKLGAELSEVGNWIRGSSDVTMKLDTDEFLAIQTNNATCRAARDDGDCRVSPYGVSKFLASWKDLVADAGQMRVAHYQESVATLDQCDPSRKDDNIGEYVLTPPEYPPQKRRKAVMDSRRFSAYDLGGHDNSYYGPMLSTQEMRTPFAILHFHARCLDTEIQNSRKAVISHGYMTSQATDEEALSQLRRYYKNINHADGMLCEDASNAPVNSHHKISIVASYLACRERFEQNFYVPPNPDHRRNPDFKQFLQDAVNIHTDASMI